MIGEFSGEYRWLSNFAPVKIELECIEYASVEHAYMSAKSHDKEWKAFCANKTTTASMAKKESAKIKIREDWDSVKKSIMEICLRQKFTQEPYRSKLLATGTEFIQEGNWWKDTYWGVYLKNGKGENHLGQLIMMIRGALKVVGA